MAKGSCWWTIEGSTDSSEVLKSYQKQSKAKSLRNGGKSSGRAVQEECQCGRPPSPLQRYKFFYRHDWGRARQQPEYLKLPGIHSIGHGGKEDWFPSRSTPPHVYTHWSGKAVVNGDDPRTPATRQNPLQRCTFCAHSYIPAEVKWVRGNTYLWSGGRKMINTGKLGRAASGLAGH